MKKLFMALSILVMFLGIMGCPSNDPADTVSKSSFTSTTVATSDTGPFPVPEPATLVMLGSGLFGLAGFGRKIFKK